MEYKISYTAYRGEGRLVECSNFEDAEKIAQFIANMPLVTDVILQDGYSETCYHQQEVAYGHK